MAFDQQFYEDIIGIKEEFENMSDGEQEAFGCVNDSDQLNRSLEFQEVSEAIDQAKLRKAYLQIPNEVLKNQNAKLVLHKFLNICFVTGLSPSDWSLSNIKPIPKPDKDPRDPLQNRCISIMCCVAKIYSWILNKRLQKHLESNDLLVDEQNGFRSARSCIDHLYVLVTVLRNRKELKKDTFVIFVDFKKAFDSVDRALLFYKLAKLGINGRMYQAIAALYTNPQSRVILEELETAYFDCPLGVKQGDCLSPSLFAIYINDLAEEIKAAGLGLKLEAEDGLLSDYLLCILMYADDIVCLAEDEAELQDIIFIIEQWCKKWQLEVNITKTNVMHIRNSRKARSRFTFIFDKQPVPYCSSYKYLGSHLNEFLDFKYTIDKHADSAGRALSSIITKMIKNNGFPYSVFAMLYDACVNSISDYCSPIMGFSTSQSLLKLHIRAIRSFLGLPKNACTPGLLSEVDLLMPEYRSKIQMVRHYQRMLSMQDHRLTKKIMLWDRELNYKQSLRTWSSEVRDIFNECELLPIYTSKETFNIRLTVTSMREAYQVIQSSRLQQDCQVKPKLRTFMLFKEFGAPAAYVGKPLSFHQRRMLAKTRLGCLPLRVETGRYSIPRLKEEERTCLVCKPSNRLIDIEQVIQQPVESEIHFLFNCTGYRNERMYWLNQLELPEGFEHFSDGEKLKIVLNKPSNIKATSQFIVNAFNLRVKLVK